MTVLSPMSKIRCFVFMCWSSFYLKGKSLSGDDITAGSETPSQYPEIQAEIFPLSKTFGEKIWIKTLHKLFLEENIPQLLTSLLSNLA